MVLPGRFEIVDCAARRGILRYSLSIRNIVDASVA